MVGTVCSGGSGYRFGNPLILTFCCNLFLDPSLQVGFILSGPTSSAGLAVVLASEFGINLFDRIIREIGTGNLQPRGGGIATPVVSPRASGSTGTQVRDGIVVRIVPERAATDLAVAIRGNIRRVNRIVEVELRVIGDFLVANRHARNLVRPDGEVASTLEGIGTRTGEYLLVAPRVRKGVLIDVRVIAPNAELFTLGEVRVRVKSMNLSVRGNEGLHNNAPVTGRIRGGLIDGGCYRTLRIEPLGVDRYATERLPPLVSNRVGTGCGTEGTDSARDRVFRIFITRGRNCTRVKFRRRTPVRRTRVRGVRRRRERHGRETSKRARAGHCKGRQRRERFLPPTLRCRN